MRVRAQLSDRSQPIHRHCAALRDIGVVHGLPCCRQDVREVQEPLVGRAFSLLWYLYGAEVGLRHAQVLRLPAGNLTVELCVAKESRTLVVLSNLCRLALGIELPVAHVAVPTRDIKRHNYSVSRLDVGHLRSDFFDYAHRLVTDDVALLKPHPQYLVEVEIRAANRRRSYAHYCVRWLLDLRVRHRVDPYILFTMPRYRLH